ncbi:unnamed protein product [Closterium sp. NIES-53]
MASRRRSNQQRSAFHQSHLTRLLSFLLAFPLIAAASAALFSLPASPAVRSSPASHLRSAADGSHAHFEALVPLSVGNENTTAVNNTATRTPTVSPFHVFRAPFAIDLIEIPEKRDPEILNLDLVDTSFPTDADAGDITWLEAAIRADALYLEDTAVRSKKGMALATSTLPDHSIFTKNEVEGTEEGEGEEEEGEEAEKGGNGELAVPLHKFRAADGSLQEEPEMSDNDEMVFGSLDALYYEEVAVRRRAAHAQPRATVARLRASLIQTRAPHARESILLQGVAAEKRGQAAGFFRSFHVFRADNGSLVELTEHEAVLTSADGVLAPLTEVNEIPLTELDEISSAELVRVHQQEFPVRFRPSSPSTSLTKIRRRLRLSDDKRIEIVYENTGSQGVEEATGEEDEEEEEVEDEEQEHVRPVHVFWGEDGALHDEEADSTTSCLTRYDGEGEDDNEVAGLGNAGWREAAVDAAAEAELEYELEFAVRTRRAMAIDGGED